MSAPDHLEAKLAARFAKTRPAAARPRSGDPAPRVAATIAMVSWMIAGRSPRAKAW